MANNFNSDFFGNNRKKLMESIGSKGPIIMVANGLVRRTKDDDAFGFHQDSNFWYLCGINEPDLILVIDEHESYIILPKRDERFVAFSGDFDIESMKKISGIDSILSNIEGWKKLSDTIAKTKIVNTTKPSPTYSQIYNVFTNPSQRYILSKIRAKKRGLKISDISHDIHKLRRVKSKQEIKAISQAIENTGIVLSQISSNYSEYKSESEIEADIIYYQIKNRLGSAFPPIIANGKNSCTLHYQSNNSLINHDQPTLIDTGYISNGYCSDITRVLASNPTQRQLEVYEAVCSVQDYAISLLKPGTLPMEYETKVAKLCGEKLVELGLIKKVDGESVHKYFKHRTSHFLGIDCHDVGDYSVPFAANNVITVEPGIYIPEENIGVRIEDNVLITDNGVINLSSGISRKLESIEYNKSQHGF